MIEQSESIKNLAEALLKAQSELGGVSENSENHFLKKKYADLGEHIKTIKPAFEKFGLVITQFIDGYSDEVGITTMLMHTSGEWLKSTARIPLEQEKGISKAQTAGKAISYLRRYALAAVANVYSGDDNDGNAEIKTTKTKSQNSNHKPAEWSALFVNETIEQSKGKITVKKHAENWLNLVKPKTVELIKPLMIEYTKCREIDGKEPEAAAEIIQELNK